ncbi:MAG TPA: MYXO-CTERM sorting domain-containing protein [Sandaracinaceae bacterium LLY-WYZ-13_1]|nr:MYXO-CTERM sorting domain-containing protein [Sandaracinaceae bacterium LLY-WYZ-13_1]
MRPAPLLLLLLAPLALPAPADAQRRIVHDTLGRDMPTAVTCGFCAGERFGVLFRELPAPRRGLEPSDFPITFDTIEIALASANVVGGACDPQTTGGTVDAAVEVWVGDAVPDGPIRDFSATDGWPSETLVWATDAAPLTPSTAETDGSGRYEVRFNALEIRDEDAAPITVGSGAYVRVVVTLPVGPSGTSDLCEPTYQSPAAFPLRDDDGRVAPGRSFIYASGAGWFWNEEVPGGSIGGDWGVRLAVFTTGGGDVDAGPSAPDAGVDADAGGSSGDASTAPDAGDAPPADPDDGGCGCRAAGGGAPPVWGGLLVALALRWRRRRSPRGLRDAPELG